MGELVELKDYRNPRDEYSESRVEFCEYRKVWRAFVIFEALNGAGQNSFMAGGNIMQLIRDEEPLITYGKNKKVLKRPLDDMYIYIVNDIGGFETGYETEEEAQEVLDAAIDYLIKYDFFRMGECCLSNL